MNSDMINKLQSFSSNFLIVSISTFIIGLIFLVSAKNATTWTNQGIYDFSGTISASAMGLAFVMISCVAFALGFWCKIKTYELE